jgi:hypothetical protein
MLANDFVGLIALNSLGAGVPRGHPPIRFEQKNRVVRHALHEAPKLLFAAPDRRLGCSTLGEISGDFSKPDEISPRIADAIDDDARPKLGSILAQAPTFAFKSTFSSCRRESPFRPACAAILFGVKSREMLAEDLGLLVPFEASRARIPARHQPVRVEHVDRVIRYRFDQQPITPVLGQRGDNPIIWCRCLHHPSFRSASARGFASHSRNKGR